MPISINGTGSITGLSAGGLPDASITADDIASNAVTTAKVNDAAVTPAKLSGGQSGSAPAYAVRAWVNFNGSGAVTIRSSGNVSSITDNGVGDFSVNFTTSIQDSDYCIVASAGFTDTSNWLAAVQINTRTGILESAQAAGSCRFSVVNSGVSAYMDSKWINVAILR